MSLRLVPVVVGSLCAGALVAGCGGGGHPHTGPAATHAWIPPAAPTQTAAVAYPVALPDLCDLPAVERAARDRGRAPRERQFLRRVARRLRADARANARAERHGGFTTGCTSFSVPVK